MREGRSVTPSGGTKAYYFGCIGQPGHYMHAEGSWRHMWPIDFQPWNLKVDGGLIPGGPRNAYGKQGVAAIHHKDGWTAISFCDRSVDTRPGCSSTFLFDTELTFDEALREAQERWPDIFARFDFEVTLAVAA